MQQQHHHQHTDSSTILKMFHKSQLGLILTFWQKRNLFLKVPAWSVRRFVRFLLKKGTMFRQFQKPCARILGIPLGMHNLG
jgi:hypothetical protein